jgi:hypothetical protein
MNILGATEEYRLTRCINRLTTGPASKEAEGCDYHV